MFSLSRSQDLVFTKVERQDEREHWVRVLQVGTNNIPMWWSFRHKSFHLAFSLHPHKNIFPSCFELSHSYVVNNTTLKASKSCSLMQPLSNSVGKQPVNLLQPCRIRVAAQRGSVGHRLGLELTLTTLDRQTRSSGVVHPHFQACKSSLKPVWALEHKLWTRTINWKVCSRSETDQISWREVILGKWVGSVGKSGICFHFWFTLSYTCMM